MGSKPFFNEKGASVNTETPLQYPEPGMKMEICGKSMNLDLCV